MRRHSGGPRPVASLAHVVEPLEPRQLLTTYTPTPIEDIFPMPSGEQFTLSAPDTVETAGFGHTGVAMGDLNADGAVDFAIAAPGRVASGQLSEINGHVFIFSGRTRSVLVHLAGDAPGFGETLAAAGDVNADGKTDLFVGSPDSAQAVIYSGANGAELRTFSGVAGSEFGYAFALIDDIDADGRRDYAIGAPTHDERGAVFIVSDTGSTLHTLTGPSQINARFGHAIILFVDIYLTSDGDREIVVGAPGFNPSDVLFDAGSYAVIDPFTGIEHASFSGTINGEAMGYSFAMYGDTRQNATVLIGAPMTSEDGRGAVYSARARSAAGAPLTEADLVIAGSDPGERLGLRIDVFERIAGQTTTTTLISGANETSWHIGDGHRRSIDAGQVLVGDFTGDGVPEFLGLPGSPSIGDAVAAFSAFDFYRPAPISGVSQDGRYTFGLPGGALDAGVADIPYIVTEDEFFGLNAIPALAAADVVVTAISNDGVVAAYGYDAEAGSVVPFLVDLANPTERQLIADLATTINDPDELLRINTLRVVAFGPEGDALINQAGYVEGSTAYSPTAWLLSGSTLWFLWSGQVRDQNGAGSILGVQFGSQAVVRSPDGAVRELEGLVDAWRFNADGSILGEHSGGDLVLSRDGVLQVVGANRVTPPVPGASEYTSTWAPLGVDSDGRAVAVLYQTYWTPPGIRQSVGTHHYTYTTIVFDTNGLPLALANVISPASPASTEVSGGIRPGDYGRFDARDRVFLLADGRIMAGNFVLTPVGDPAPLTVQGPLTAAAMPNGPATLGENASGVPILVLPGANGAWINVALAQLDGAVEHALYNDPKDGAAYIIAFGSMLLPDGTVATGAIYKVEADATLGPAQVIFREDAEIITSKLALFTSTDSRVHAMGLNAAKQVVLFYQTGTANDDGSSAWSSDNLSVNHFEPQGFTTPDWSRDEPSAYVAPWNGLNVAGMDQAGNVWVVWWAPGQSLWSVENLNLLVGLGGFSKALTTYVTPWGGLNVSALDGHGDLHVLWWVPGFERNWRHNNMTDEFDGIVLVNASAFVTSWGGLNIAGIDSQTGHAAVYWWAPGMGDWVSQEIPTEGADASRILSSKTPFAPVIIGSQQNLLATSFEGDVVRLSWNPGDGDVWTLENLTELAS